MRPQPLHVAVAVIVNAAGELLLTQRLPGTHLAGLWEFPGGKLEEGEDIHSGLRREIREELGLQIKSHRPLIQSLHNYIDRSVWLDVHLITEWQGTAVGLEGQELAWVKPDNIAQYQLPPADHPIVTALRLAPCYWITPTDIDEDRLCKRLAELLNNRARETALSSRQLLQLRLPGHSTQQLADLIARIRQQDWAREVDLVVKDVALAEALDCGVHLSATALMQLKARPLSKNHWVGASCHNADELQQARAIGCDFATLSPVLPTASHPGEPTLGWHRFAAMTKKSALPIYALGGMRSALLPQAWDAGAQGIALLSELWRNAK